MRLIGAAGSRSLRRKSRSMRRTRNDYWSAYEQQKWWIADVRLLIDDERQVAVCRKAEGMKHGILIVALVMPLLVSCASRRAPARGVTAIYSPPVRLGGQGSMIFLPAPVPAVPPAPPSELTRDYMPGPWSIFFEANTDRPASESQVALEQIASMTSRFPTIGLYLCSIGPSGPRGSGIEDRRRLEAVRSLLTRSGVRRAVAGPENMCKSLEPRPEPFVLVMPATD